MKLKREVRALGADALVGRGERRMRAADGAGSNLRLEDRGVQKRSEKQVSRRGSRASRPPGSAFLPPPCRWPWGAGETGQL